MRIPSSSSPVPLHHFWPALVYSATDVDPRDLPTLDALEELIDPRTVAMGARFTSMRDAYRQWIYAGWLQDLLTQEELTRLLAYSPPDLDAPPSEPVTADDVAAHFRTAFFSSVFRSIG